jgi:hypothetical protein
MVPDQLLGSRDASEITYRKSQYQILYPERNRSITPFDPVLAILHLKITQDSHD